VPASQAPEYAPYYAINMTGYCDYVRNRPVTRPGGRTVW